MVNNEGDLENVLQEIGLSGNSARVYLSLLRLKSATAGEISRDTGLERRNCYDVLEKLIRKGFVTFVTRNNVKYFQAADVYNLVGLLEEKKRMLEEIMPQLKEMEKKRMLEEISVYEGKEGLKMILEGALEFAEGSEIVGFGDNGKLGAEILPEFIARWNEKRIKREITLRTIFINTEEAIKIAKKAARMKMRKARISPIPFSSQIGIWVCKERSIIWLLGEKPIAIMIRNEEISKGFRDFFDQMWEMSRKV